MATFDLSLGRLKTVKLQGQSRQRAQEKFGWFLVLRSRNHRAAFGRNWWYRSTCRERDRLWDNWTGRGRISPVTCAGGSDYRRILSILAWKLLYWGKWAFSVYLLFECEPRSSLPLISWSWEGLLLDFDCFEVELFSHLQQRLQRRCIAIWTIPVLEMGASLHEATNAEQGSKNTWLPSTAFAPIVNRWTSDGCLCRSWEKGSGGWWCNARVSCGISGALTTVHIEIPLEDCISIGTEGSVCTVHFDYSRGITEDEMDVEMTVFISRFSTQRFISNEYDIANICHHSVGSSCC